jgi:hypothetical protein
MRSVRHQPSNRHSSTISPQNARSRTGIDDQSEEVLILSPIAHRDRSQNPLPEFVAHPTNVISLLLTTVRVASSFLPAWPSFWFSNHTADTHLSPPPRRPLAQFRHLSPFSHTSALPSLLPLIPLIVVRLPFTLQYPANVFRRDFKLAR